MVEDTISEDQKLGSVGALKQIRDQINVPSESRVLVIGGDNISSLDVLEFVNYHTDNPDRSLVALYDIRDFEKAKLYGVAKIGRSYHSHAGGDKQILDFEEKPKNPKSTLVSTAIYVFRAVDLASIEDYIAQSNSADTIGSYIKWLIGQEDTTSGDVGHYRYRFGRSEMMLGVNGFIFEGYWFDIGSHESFEEANRFFRRTPHTKY